MAKIYLGDALGGVNGSDSITAARLKGFPTLGDAIPNLQRFLLVSSGRFVLNVNNRFDSNATFNGFLAAAVPAWTSLGPWAAGDPVYILTCMPIANAGSDSNFLCYDLGGPFTGLSAFRGNPERCNFIIPGELVSDLYWYSNNPSADLSMTIGAYAPYLEI